MFRCEIPECDQYPIEFKPRWLSNAVPFDGKREPLNCKRYTSSLYTSSNLLRNSSEVIDQCSKTGFFNHSIEVTCNKFIYETDEWTVGREVCMCLIMCC